MYYLRSKSRKIRTCPSDPSTPELLPSAWSLPSLSYQSSRHTQQDRRKSKSKRSPDRLPPLSKGKSRNFGPTSNDSKKGISRCGQISIGSEQKHTSKLTEFLLAHRASSQMASASSTSRSPSVVICLGPLCPQVPLRPHSR